MKELIKITDNKLVSAKELYTFLEIGRDFSTWCKQMFGYGFIEGKDFSPISGKSSGGRPSIDYALTIECAKHWAMIQRSEKGMQARQYFIDFENLHKQQKPELPQTFAEALRLAADQAERLEQLEPKGKVYDQISDSGNLLTLNEAAKSIGIGRNKMMKELRLMNILRRNNTPFQSYIDRGYFLVKVKPIAKGDIVENYTQTFVTGKGLTWLSEKF